MGCGSLLLRYYRDPGLPKFVRTGAVAGMFGMREGGGLDGRGGGGRCFFFESSSSGGSFARGDRGGGVGAIILPPIGVS